MIPTISNKTLLRTKVERNKMSAVTAIAPTKAAVRMARKPETVKIEVETVPPNNSITKATPKPAPELIPNTSGPAKGLRKAV